MPSRVIPSPRCFRVYDQNHVFSELLQWGANPPRILQHDAELAVKAIRFKVNVQIMSVLLPSCEHLRELRDEFSLLEHVQQFTLFRSK